MLVAFSIYIYTQQKTHLPVSEIRPIYRVVSVVIVVIAADSGSVVDVVFDFAFTLKPAVGF